VDLKERGKGYCPYMIATVAKHRRDKYNQDAFIRVEKDNLAALSCYKKILLMKSTGPRNGLIVLKKMIENFALNVAPV
jgi:hypothetical protein